jgi:hypothetical protein
VKPCPNEKLPPGLKTDPAAKYLEENQDISSHFGVSSDCDDELGYLDTTVSESAKQDFDRWRSHDEEATTYCDVGDQRDADADFVDLLINPERYTGYRGESAHRIWKSIYEENCFKPEEPVSNPFEALKGMCLEKRAFYRAVSGLHSSINIHLCAKWVFNVNFLRFKRKNWQ